MKQIEHSFTIFSVCPILLVSLPFRRNTMFRIESPFAYTKKIIYDLEFSGDLRDRNGINCCIWQIALKDFDTGEKFCTLINPYKRLKRVPKPVDIRYKMPTKQMFYDQNAPDIIDAMYKVKHFFLQCLKQQGNICLLSHNGFRSDKLVFENALVRYDIYNLFMDIPLYFFDTLYYFRQVYPGLPSYSLANLYMEKFEKEIQDAHDATVDVDKLDELLKKDDKQIYGTMYMLFATPFTNISGFGSYTEQCLARYGFSSVEHLVSSFQHNYQRITSFLETTPLKDRANMLVKRLYNFSTNELNQRTPRLVQQRQDLMQETSV